MFLKHLPLNHRTRLWAWFAVVVPVACVIVLNSANAQTATSKEQPHGDDGSVLAERVASSVHPPKESDPHSFEQSIWPLLEQACFDCHSGESVEGNFRADQLDPDLVEGDDIEWWLEVYSAISKGDMPPPESSELADEDRIRIVDWLSTEIQAAEQDRKASGHQSPFRRLTRYEYNYALQDLLGVPWTFAEELPSEASEDDAFENSAESLHMSVKQVETYHRLALTALRRVTVRGDRPEPVHWAIAMEDAFQREKRKLDRDIESARQKLDDQTEKLAAEIKRLTENFQTPEDRSHYLDTTTGMRAEVDWNYRKAQYAFRPSGRELAMPNTRSHVAVVQPGQRQALTVELGDRLPNRGMMRVRVRASRAAGPTGNEEVEQRLPSLQLHFGFQATDQGRSIQRLSQQDVAIKASFGQSEVYQWDIPLSEIEHRNTYRGETKLGDQPSPSEYIRLTNTTVVQDGKPKSDAAILIDFVEVAAPVYETWPPTSHRRVFVESEHANDESLGGSIDEDLYAEEIIKSFMTRAWRGPPTDRDLDRKRKLYRRLRPSSSDFQEAIVEVLATILTSPKFLYVLPGAQPSQEDQLSENELATRLSLFLWCSLPDETLLDLASEGRLNDHDVRLEQVERLLADPRSERFSEHFVTQWLKMRPLEFLSPTGGPNGLDEALLESMKREPIALFNDMLRHDSSVLEFIDSDYVVVNARLAKHYGIPSVPGNHFRRVASSPEVNRGGLLTQAGLLTMNSDGKDSHPVKRGVWLLTNLLNDPPPPPPPAVPEINLSDPEVAKMTLKERIEDHRNHAACMSCHKKIDPWGIAFENFDALGRWRDRIDGKVVDASSVLPNNAKLDGMTGLRKHLSQDRREQFVMAMVENMASFALGRQLEFGDRAAIREITQRVHQSDNGIRTMVNCLVTSKLFQSR